MKLIEWPYYRADFLLTQGLSATAPSRFWSNVYVGPRCWMWSGYSADKRYGRLSRGIKPRGIAAHRLSWILHFGPIPDGLHVLHRCDVTMCVRPDHLWLGTDRDNHLDCLAKGRWHQLHYHGVPSEQCHTVKLTWDIIEAIRRDFALGCVTQTDLARRYDVNQTTISKIVLHKTWIR